MIELGDFVGSDSFECFYYSVLDGVVSLDNDLVESPLDDGLFKLVVL